MQARRVASVLICSLSLGLTGTGADLTVSVTDASGAAGRTGAPVCVPVLLPEALGLAATEGRLVLVETAAGTADAAHAPAQFEATTDGEPNRGRLWWLLPPGAAGERHFSVREGPQPVAAGLLRVAKDDATGQYRVLDGEHPVLQYNYQTVPFPTPDFLDSVPEGSRRYAVPRSDYIHPLYGPGGEVLTADWPKDHPHHRGLYWAWPEVDWNQQRGDLHALQTVFARPTGKVRFESGPVFALLEAQNEWRWQDQTPIVREVVTLRVFRAGDRGRGIDLCLRVTALAGEVSLARRGTNAYGGLSPRLTPFTDRSLTSHTDPLIAADCRAWADLTGVPAGATARVGLTTIERDTNPGYPNAWVQFPELSWLQPAFPRAGTRWLVTADQPLTLEYRLWVHAGDPDPAVLADQWTALNRPAGVPGTQVPAPLAPAWRLIQGYRFGQSRQSLVEIEAALRAATPEQYPAFEASLLAGLSAPGASAEAKAFICDQLALVGSARAVPALVGCLGAEPALAQAARDALLGLSGESVNAALRQALPTLDGAALVGVVDLLARRRDTAAVQLVTPLATAPDLAVRRAAIAALGQLGAAAALQALPAAPEVALALTEARLACARALQESGQAPAAAELYRQLWADAALPVHYRLGALRGLAFGGSGAAVATLVQACRDPDPRLQAEAVRQLARLRTPQARDQLRSLLPELAPPLALVALACLRDQGAAAADLADAVAALTRSADESVRLAALETLGEIGTVGEVPVLVAALAETGALGRAAAESLARLRGTEVNPALVALLGDASQRLLLPALLGVLVRRQATEAATALLPWASVAEAPVRQAAFAALGALGSDALLPKLLDLARSAPAEGRAAAADAVAAVCERSGEREKAVAAVLAGVEAGEIELRVALLPALARLGGEAVRKALLEALQAGESGLREATVRGLASSPDPAVLPALFEVAAKPEPVALQVLAVQGLVRLVDSGPLAADDKVQQLRRIWQVARRVEEWRQVLSALAKIRTLEALALAAETLTAEGAQAEAAQTLAAVVLPRDNEPGLRGARVVELLKAAVPQIADSATRERVDAYLAGLPQPGPANLALDAPTRASVASQGPWVTGKAVDGDASLGSYWSGDNTPAWFEADLGALHRISRVLVIFYWDGQRYYQYTIETSTDGQTWQAVVDQRANTVISRPEGFVHNFGPVEARYVRVNLLKNSANPGAHIVELVVSEAAAAGRR